MTGYLININNDCNQCMECVEVCQNKVLTEAFINMVKLTLKIITIISGNMFKDVLIVNHVRLSVNNMQYGLLIQNVRNYNENKT